MSGHGTTYGRGGGRGRGAAARGGALRLDSVLGAGLLAAAGLMHMAVVRAHLEDGFIDPMLFTATAWGQLFVAGWLLRVPGRSAWLAALGVSVLPGVAWAVSRTVGLPWGHTAGSAEDVRVIGAVTTTLEAAVAVLAVVVGLLGAGWVARPGLRALAPAALAGALLVAGTSSAVLAAPVGHQHGGGGHTEGGSGPSEQHGSGEATPGHGHEQEATPGHGHEQEQPTATPSTPEPTSTSTPTGSEDHEHAGDHDHDH